MNYRVSETLVLLVNVVKWIILASVTGLFVGLSTTLILKSLGFVLAWSSSYSYSLFLLPFGLMISAWLTSSYAPEAGGQGLERVIQAVHFRSGKIQGQVIPAKLIATLCTIGVGGSAGIVGPCAQIGGGLASVWSTLCHLDKADRKTLVICGISAGFASVLGTPIAGAFFGVEALFVGSLAYQVLLPSVIAATISHQVTVGFGIQHWSTPLEAVPSLSLSILPWVIVSGLLFGLCAILFIEVINLGLHLSLLMTLHPMIKGFLGGCSILIVAMFVSPQVLGSWGGCHSRYPARATGHLVYFSHQNFRDQYYAQFWRQWRNYTANLFCWNDARSSLCHNLRTFDKSVCSPRFGRLAGRSHQYPNYGCPPRY